jgi:hypothetical protein
MRLPGKATVAAAADTDMILLNGSAPFAYDVAEGMELPSVGVALRAAAESGITDQELLSTLTVCEGMTRRLDQVVVTTVATLDRRGAFAERGYKSPTPRRSCRRGAPHWSKPWTRTVPHPTIACLPWSTSCD